MTATVEDMHLVVRQRRQGSALSTGLLIASIVFGVLLMHSVTPTTSMSMPMRGGHAPMASPAAVDSSVPAALGEHACPYAHQMIHPCVGTTVSWPALAVPTMSGEIDLSPTSSKWLARRADSPQERAPPWTLWELDESVTLRV